MWENLKIYIKDIIFLFWELISSHWIFHTGKIKQIQEELGLIKWRQAVGTYEIMNELNITDAHQALQIWIRRMRNNE